MSKSKERIKNYLQQNKISELFEQMMGKLVRDLPASPIYYLVNFLQEKEKEIKHIVRDDVLVAKEKKLELTNNAKLWATTPTVVKKPTSRKVSSPQQQPVEGRKYDKPWVTQPKKSPPKSGKLHQTSPVGTSKDLDWSKKTRVSTESTDKNMNGDDGVDLGLVYPEPKFVGQTRVKIRSTEEEMQEEVSLSGTHKDNESHTTKATHAKISAKQAKRRRFEELRRLADKTHLKLEPRSNSPIVVDDGTEDDALEVLENANELMSEGIKNPPKTGVVVSRSGQKSKEEIELVLNMSKFFDELGGMEGINQSQVDGSNVQNQIAEDDDDFESASQVTGPRRPVWEAPESEVESVASQLRSTRISGIGVESFVTRPDSAGKPVKDPKPEKSKSKTSKQRSRTAPSRSRSNVDLNLSDGNGSQVYRVPDPKSVKSSPKGSVVGSGQARQGASQPDNHSEPAAPTKKNENVKEKIKEKASDRADDVPDSKSNQS